MDKIIENKELKKRILASLHKTDSDSFSQEDLDQVENIGFTQRLVNGKHTHIDVINILLFNNLKYLTLRHYILTMRELRFISEHKSIKEVSFLNCTFQDVDFDELSSIPEILKFDHCSCLPSKFPKVNKIIVFQTDIDFHSIDLSKVISIRIENSTIKNIYDIDKYEQLLDVNLDGSELFNEDHQKISDISVPKNCLYSHKEQCLYCCDD